MHVVAEDNEVYNQMHRQHAVEENAIHPNHLPIAGSCMASVIWEDPDTASAGLY